MVNKLKLYSKSSVGTDWSCPRKHWFNYYYNGTGITTTNTPLEYFLGTAIHDGLAAIALSHPDVDIELIATTAYKQIEEGLLPLVVGEADGENFVKEQATLVEGLLRGFFKHSWPRLIERYPIIKMVEQPMIIVHDAELGMMNKPDLVLSTEAGENVYVEYKTTSSKKEGWVNSWNTAVQVHATIKAIEEKLGEPVTHMIVQGLYKGWESYGKQSSSFCYAYKKKGNPPFSNDQIAYEYKAGFRRFPTWELEGGVKRWIDMMPENVLADQFPQTPPIFINEDLIQAFFRQRKHREQEIADAVLLLNDDYQRDKVGVDVQTIMDATFPQRFDQCYPSFGKPCPFVKLCHGPAMDPLQNGFVVRDVSHQAEFRDLLVPEEEE